MLNIKETKDGGIALIFKQEYKDSAYKLAQIALQGFIEGKVTHELQEPEATKVVTLDSIKERIEKRQIEQIPTTLPIENTGDIITSIIFQKIKDTFGKESPVYFTTFYKDLEKVTGIDLSKIHRDRTEGRDTREYPYRKIDSVLTVVNPQTVKDFAQGYFFKRKGVAN